MEDITKRNPKVITKNNSLIHTILFDSLTETLLVGDDNGHVKQYQMTYKSKFFGLLKNSDLFTLLKDYGDLGVGQVLESF